MLPELKIPNFDDQNHEGVRIAGCRLLRLLEDGGTTRSYVANYLETSLVVVKLFDDRLIRTTGEQADMYEWECDVLLNLRHRCLPVTVRFGHRPDLGCRYLVQEYVFGESLARVRRHLGRPMTPGEAADTLKPIADALVLCHSQGVTHGHISAVHVILQEGDPLPHPRLVGLRPTLGALAAASTDDAFSLTALAYALTAPEGAAPISAIQDGAATAGFPSDATWGEVLTMGLTSRSESRMLDLRDGLADVLDTDPCMHQRTRSLAKAVIPMRPPDELLDSDIEAVDFEQIDPDPISVIEPPSPREDIVTAPTTLWQSPAGSDEAYEEYEAELESMEPVEECSELDLDEDEDEELPVLRRSLWAAVCVCAVAVGVTATGFMLVLS